MSNKNAKEQVFAPTNSHWVAEVIELRKEVDDLRQRFDQLQQIPQHIKTKKQLEYGIYSDALLRYTSFICCIIFGVVATVEFEFLYLAFLPSLVTYLFFKYVRPFEKFESMEPVEKPVIAYRVDISLGLISCGIFLFLLFIEPKFTSNLENFSYLSIPTLVPAYTFIVLRPLHKLTVALTTSDHSIE